VSAAFRTRAAFRGGEQRDRDVRCCRSSQGIDNAEIIDIVRARPAPMISANASLRL
jgi:hypothetical protein